jgi:hypothetical protein
VWKKSVSECVKVCVSVNLCKSECEEYECVCPGVSVHCSYYREPLLCKQLLMGPSSHQAGYWPQLPPQAAESSLAAGRNSQGTLN